MALSMLGSICFGLKTQDFVKVPQEELILKLKPAVIQFLDSMKGEL